MVTKKELGEAAEGIEWLANRLLTWIDPEGKDLESRRLALSEAAGVWHHVRCEKHNKDDKESWQGDD